MHIIQRGNNRTLTFVDRQDYSVYLALLQLTRKRARCAVHAYVLMRNHVHLLVTPETRRGPAHMMQELGSWYVRYFNQRHGRTGTLLEGRYRSTLIDSERYFLACARYIELNPVRAGIVDDPADFEWSSFRGNAFGAVDRLLTPHETYRTLGAGRTERQSAYRALFDQPLGTLMVEAIRTAAKRGTPLGGALWTQRLEARLERRLSRLSHGGHRRRTRRSEAGSTSEGGEVDVSLTTLTP